MKKKVLCIFVLLFYLLIACTILSVKIEREMAVETESYLREGGRYNTAGITLAPRALFQDDEGQHLYEVVEGTGWESGLRMQEIPANLWDIDVHGMVILQGSRDYNVAYSASRQPEEGDLAVIIENWENADDQYLVIFSEGIPAEVLKLPENVEIIGQSDQALLLAVKNAVFPFFEHRARSLSETFAEQECRIFSVTESMQLLEMATSLKRIVWVLVWGLILWGVFCWLINRANRKSVLIACSLGMMAVSLCILQFTLNGIDLPSSMLPAENIFDWQHYREEYALIFEAMESLGPLP